MVYTVYGAQAIALGTYNAIKALHPEIEIECFLVSEIGNNASTLGGIPVRELQEFVSRKSEDEKDDMEILIATPENVMDEIESSLEAAGIYGYIRLDSVRWADLQERAFVRSRIFTPISTYPVGCKMPDIEVYKMVHFKDKPLRSGYTYPDFFKSVQVGAAIAENLLVELTDDKGESISDKNGNYSELTGLYWMWKNRVQSDGSNGDMYYGLAHYRRFLDLSEDDLKRLAANGIDVVLPYPMPYEPDMEAHHKRYLTDPEWAAVLQALEELQPTYIEASKKILKQNYMYNYNVILAKRNVLNRYCSWLFPLLFRIEEINDPDGVKPPNRYIGYVAETLESIYFMNHQDDMKIAHARCRFLV